MGRALIVSAGANSNEYIAARLSEMGYSRPVIIPSGAEARRRMSESDFELIVVNAPLPDEFGHELCITAVEQTDAGVVFLVKAAQAEQLLAPLNEQGVLLLSKPFTTPLFLQAMHMAAAGNHRLQRLRQENARLQDKIGQLFFACGEKRNTIVKLLGEIAAVFQSVAFHLTDIQVIFYNINHEISSFHGRTIMQADTFPYSGYTGFQKCRHAHLSHD